MRASFSRRGRIGREWGERFARPLGVWDTMHAVLVIRRHALEQQPERAHSHPTQMRPLRLISNEEGGLGVGLVARALVEIITQLLRSTNPTETPTAARR